MSEEESLGGDIEDAVTHEYIELQEGIYGKITNTLPNLPFVNERLTVADVETCSNTYEDYNVKPCFVTLEKIDETSLIFQYDNKLVTDEDKEQQEIERLLNLNGLENKRKRASSPSTSTKKIKTNSKKPSSDISDIDLESDDSSDEAHSNLRENVYPVVNTDTDGLDVLENLLKEICEEDDDNVEEEDDNVEEKSESDDSSKRERNKDKIQNQSDKENQQVVISPMVDEPHNSNLKTDKDSNWRADPLLTCSLKEKPERDSIISNLPKVIDENKLLDRIKKLEARMMKPSTVDLADTTDNKNEVLTDKEVKPGTSTLNCISDEEEEDVEAKYSKIIVDSESDSDIEFVSVYKNLKKSKDDKNDLDDSEVRKGRRNIRAILDYETLTRATKEAYQLERKRKNRLTQKQKNMDAVLSSSQLSEEEEGLILDIDETTKTPTITVDRTLSKKLKPHQKLGVKFMWESCYEGVNQIKNKYPGSGCILAHCMGLGKTYQVIALIHTLFSHQVTETKHVLIITPLSVVLHWKKEFELAFKNIKNDYFKIFFISDSRLKNIERMTIVNKWRRESGVLTMGYESYHRLITPKNPDSITPLESNVLKALSDPGPDLIVLDEGHLIKNDHSIRSKSFRRLKTKRRIVLTGTPLQNNLTEYYYMIQFVKPNLLGSLHEYKNRFANPITNGQYHDSTEVDIIQMKKRSHVLNKLLKSTVQRFELSELVSYLKKRHDYALFIQLHPLQMELYEKEAQLASSASEQTVTYKQVLGDYHKFKFIWSHPYMFHLKEVAARAKDRNCLDTNFWWNGFCPPDSDINVNYGPKFKVMLNIIRECEKIGDKILVFSNSLFELSAIEHFLQQYSTSDSKWECNKDYIRMDGSTSIERRIQFCDSFNDKNNSRLRVFLISNKVGQMGINLIGANRVILMDVSWNPAQDVQSVFRIYRFGQEKECYIYRLISMGTMEEVVYDRQVTKLAISGRVIDSLQITRHFKSNDLQMLYRPRFNRNQIRPTPPLPADCLLAKVLQSCNEVFRYHEHQSLLENLPEENLNEDEMKLAWDEFNKENEHENQLQMRNKALMNTIVSASNAAQNGIFYVEPSVEHNPQVPRSSVTPFSTTALNSSTFIRNNQILQCKRVIARVEKKTNENNAVINVENDNANSNKTETVTSHKRSSTVLHIEKTNSDLAPKNNNNDNRYLKNNSTSIDLTLNSKNKLNNSALEASTSNTTTLQQPNLKQTAQGKSDEGNVIIVETSSNKTENVTSHKRSSTVLHIEKTNSGLVPKNNSNNNRYLKNNSTSINLTTNSKNELINSALGASTSDITTLQQPNLKQTGQGKSNEGNVIIVESSSNKTENVTNFLHSQIRKGGATILHKKKILTGLAPINNSNDNIKLNNSIPIGFTTNLEASTSNIPTLQHLNSKQTIQVKSNEGKILFVQNKKKISTSSAPINNSNDNKKLNNSIPIGFPTNLEASTSNIPTLQHLNSKQIIQGKSNEQKNVQNKKKISTGPVPINSSNNSKKLKNNIPMDLTSHSNNKVIISGLEASASDTTTSQHPNSKQIILENNKTKNVVYDAHNQTRKSTVLHKKKISTGPALISSSKNNAKLKNNSIPMDISAVGASTSDATFLQQPNSKQTLPLKNKTDEIITLDDDNLLMMEQQLLITQLHQNLDLTLSAIQTSKPKQSIQTEQKEDIIEID